MINSINTSFNSVHHNYSRNNKTIQDINHQLQTGKKKLTSTQLVDSLNTSQELTGLKSIAKKIDAQIAALTEDKIKLLSISSHLETINEALSDVAEDNQDKLQTMAMQMNDILSALKNEIKSVKDQTGELDLNSSCIINTCKLKANELKVTLQQIDLTELEQALGGKKNEQGVIYNHTDIGKAAASLTKILAVNLGEIENKGKTLANFSAKTNTQITELHHQLEEKTTLSPNDIFQARTTQANLEQRNIMSLAMLQKSAAYHKEILNIIRRMLQE